MSKKELIARQSDYGIWAKEKLLQEARQLSEEQYHAEPGIGGVGSVHDLLLHTLATEWVWRNLAQNGELPGPPPRPESLADIEAAWQEEDAAYRTFLDGLSDADLEAEINTVSPAGQAFTFARWQMMQHVLMHSMQHRTELAAVLTSLGHSPGDLDFVFFTMGRE
jgi:uncharacterized damage-inducible protein DinB